MGIDISARRTQTVVQTDGRYFVSSIERIKQAPSISKRSWSHNYCIVYSVAVCHVTNLTFSATLDLKSVFIVWTERNASEHV